MVALTKDLSKELATKRNINLIQEVILQRIENQHELSTQHWNEIKDRVVAAVLLQQEHLLQLLPYEIHQIPFSGRAEDIETYIQYLYQYVRTKTLVNDRIKDLPVKKYVSKSEFASLFRLEFFKKKLYTKPLETSTYIIEKILPERKGGKLTKSSTELYFKSASEKLENFNKNYQSIQKHFLENRPAPEQQIKTQITEYLNQNNQTNFLIGLPTPTVKQLLPDLTAPAENLVEQFKAFCKRCQDYHRNSIQLIQALKNQWPQEKNLAKQVAEVLQTTDTTGIIAALPPRAIPTLIAVLGQNQEKPGKNSIKELCTKIVTYCDNWNNLKKKLQEKLPKEEQRDLTLTALTNLLYPEPQNPQQTTTETTNAIIARLSDPSPLSRVSLLSRWEPLEEGKNPGEHAESIYTTLKDTILNSNRSASQTSFTSIVSKSGKRHSFSRKKSYSFSGN